MDARTLEKLRVALHSVPYVKFYNEISTQTENNGPKNLERNEVKNNFVTPSNKEEKPVVYERRKLKSERATDKKENISQSQFCTFECDILDVKIDRNIPKYLIPTIVISTSKKSKIPKTRKHPKKVKFTSSEKIFSDQCKNNDQTSQNDKEHNFKHSISTGAAKIVPTKHFQYKIENKRPLSNKNIFRKKHENTGLMINVSERQSCPSPQREKAKQEKSKPIKYQTINLPNSYLNIKSRSKLYASTFNTLPPKSISQARYFSKQDPFCVCECNSMAKQYGRYFCSEKRTTKSGIFTGDVRGKSILKDCEIHQMTKDMIQERLLLHGVGCRYRRSRLDHPWFIQEDVANGGPLYFRILPGLHVGNFRDSKDQEQLNKHSITHILAIHDNARKLPCNSDKEYLCIIASDSPGQNLTQFFPVCNDFIHTARLKGGNILIHCLAGMSRSVTVAVVYVMCVTSLSWRDALKAVQGARNVANPNVGFLKQLQEFEKERLQDERRRIKEKYPDTSLTEEDEQMAKELLTSYYHYMSLGEMCDGNCQHGVVCPRGLCNQPRSSGIFRRNSRENSSNRSTSPLGKRPSSPANTNTSPKCSPEQSRNPSPTSSPNPQRVSSNNLTPPVSPYHPRRPVNTNGEPSNSGAISPESPSRSRKPCGSFYGQPTPPGSPSRSYGYYTRSQSRSLISSPSSSHKNDNHSSGNLLGSPSRSFRQGKIIHCPSTPPSSPARSHKNRNQNVSQLTPPTSPMRVSRNKNRGDGNTSPTRNMNENDRHISTSSHNGEIINKRNGRGSLKNNIIPSPSHKKITRLCQRETKSLDLSSPPETPVNDKNPKINFFQQSVPSSPAKRRTKGSSDTHTSPSRFCQAVTRLLPQIVTLNNSSKLCKNIPKPFVRIESALYVDEKGRSTLKPAKADDTSSSSSTNSSNDSRTSTNPSVTYDEDDDTRIVIFELCKNIQKLPRECEINYEPSKKTIENDLMPERKGSVHTTIDISTYTNNTNTNIIINPIFSLENKYEAESLCNNKAMVRYNGKQNFSAFLDDDMIYVETTESKSSEGNHVNNSDSPQNNTQEKGVTLSKSTPISVPSQRDNRMKCRENEKLETKLNELEANNSITPSNQSLQKDFSKNKGHFSSFKPGIDTMTTDLKEVVECNLKEMSFDTIIASTTKHFSSYEDLKRSEKDDLKMANASKDSNPPIYAVVKSSRSAFSKKASRPPSGPPPPIPPRKRKNPSNGRPLTPPPVPPRNMKPPVQSLPADINAQGKSNIALKS